MTNKKLYVEPKHTKKEEIVLDLSRQVVNDMSDMIEAFEVYIDLTGKMPDKIILNDRQYVWYTDRIRRFAEVMGFDTARPIKKFTFRGLPVESKNVSY